MLDHIPNTGLVTDQDASLDPQFLAKYLTSSKALIAQGGGQKGIFTSGVVDALLMSNFDPFTHFYGTSAGAMNITAYLCRQQKLGHQFIAKLTTDSRFFSLYGFMRKQRKLDMEWAIQQLYDYPFKLDLDMGKRVLGRREAYASVTNARTLKDSYLPIFTPDWGKVMEASCAIPHLHKRSVEIDGQEFIDGGVSASIPAQEAWRREARCIVVIRTEPIDIELEQPPFLSELQTKEQPPSRWYNESIQWLQEYWSVQKQQWQQDWRRFVDERVASVQAQKKTSKGRLLNGGRWLFGADDVYRLSQLLGGDLSSEMIDKLMVHYQTYRLTQQFLQYPPQDCFVLQIAPKEPLVCRALLSDIDSIEADYQTGLDAGFRFVEQFQGALDLSNVGNSGSSSKPYSHCFWDTY